MTPIEFAAKLLELCIRENCSVTSWYRTKLRNAYVGGKHTSQHLIGLAADVVPDTWPVVSLQFLTKCSDLQLKVIIEKTHVHVYVR